MVCFNVAIASGSLLLVAVATLVPLLVDSVELKQLNNHWHSYKLKHGKVYEDELEEARRRIVFEENVREIFKFNKHVAPKVGYKKGINHLTDRTRNELNKLNGLWLDTVKDDEMCTPSDDDSAYIEKLIANKTGPVPAAFDWRQVPGRVSGVKNQGNCGSCWAFAAVGALEGQEMTQNKSLKSIIGLSEQQLIECDHESAGCHGGFPINAFDYVAKNGGIDDDKTYPYTASFGAIKKCHYKSFNRKMSDSGGVYLDPSDETRLQELLYKLGPISIGMDASDLSPYESGVFSSSKCLNNFAQLNHGLTLVGYGTDPKLGDYWIVKNSWGETWGENGFFRLARNQENMCGVASCPMFPKFKIN